MAHAFDNQNLISSKQQQTFHSDASLSPKPERKNVRKDTSPFRPLPSRSSHSSLSREDINFNRPIENQEISAQASHSSFLSNDVNYRQVHQARTNEYLQYIPEKDVSSTKPPSPVRISRIVSTTDNDHVGHTNIVLPYAPDKTKTNTTYLNTTQLYITQPSSINDPPPPPPPPRCPIHPPVIPPRNLIINQQKNSVTIPDFISSISPRIIYREPITSSTMKRNDLNRDNSLDNPVQSPSVDNNHHSPETITNQSTTGEYFGECSKCGETITSLDDPCDVLGQIYHSSCAVCVVCGRSVKNRHFFMQDQLYCEEDFLYTGFQETLVHCVVCDHLITDTILQALGQSYHSTCFKCSKCSICLDGIPFIKDKYNNLFCVHDYHATYGPRCNKCSNPIFPEDGSNETVRIVSMGKNFHVRCYQCEDCSMQLGNEQDRRCHPLDDRLLCQECYHRRFISYNKF